MADADFSATDSGESNGVVGNKFSFGTDDERQSISKGLLLVGVVGSNMGKPGNVIGEGGGGSYT